MIVKETRFTTHQEAGEFLETMRRYLRLVRTEAGCARAELRRVAGQVREYVLHEAFRDQPAYDIHLAAAYTARLHEHIESFTTSTVRNERFDVVLQVPLPPPVPRHSRPEWESAAHSAPKQPAFPHRSPPPELFVRLDALELATGTDGPFRGHPDPCLLIGAYALGIGQPRTLGRSLVRVRVDHAAPCVVDSNVVFLKMPLFAKVERIALLLVALEENGGAGVQRVYQELHSHETLLLWAPSEAQPNPRPLGDFAGPASESVLPLDVLAHGDPLRDSVHDDTWVGAGIAVVDLRTADPWPSRRFQFASNPKTNDWVAVVRTEVV